MIENKIEKWINDSNENKAYPILILKRDINKVMGFPYNISVSPYKYWIFRLLFAVDKKRGTSTQILIPLINAYFKRFYAIL